MILLREKYIIINKYERELGESRKNALNKERMWNELLYFRPKLFIFGSLNYGHQ